MKNNNNQDTVQDAITAGIVATSKSPFSTAFKVTMGIYAAQLLGLLIFVSLIGGLILWAKS